MIILFRIFLFAFLLYYGSIFGAGASELPNQFDLEVSYCNGAMHEAAKVNSDAHQAEAAAVEYINKRIATGINPKLFLPSAVQGSGDWEKISNNTSDNHLLTCLGHCGPITENPEQYQCAIDCWKQANEIERHIVFTCLHIDRKITSHRDGENPSTE